MPWARRVASAAGSSTAVVVIDTGAAVRHTVIHFDGSISGIDALQLAGANPVTYGFQGQGAAVCALDGVGNPADQSCLIGPHGEYWAYFVATGGSTSWAYSRGCACTTTVHDGDVEGWRYGTGTAPSSSADFSAYVDCAPPATSPPAGGGAGASPGNGPGGTTGETTPGTTGGTTPGTTGGSSDEPSGAPSAGPSGGQSGGTVEPGGAGSTDAAAGNPEPDDAGSAAPPTSTTPPTTTSRPRDRNAAQVEAAAVHRRSGGGGGGDAVGSPPVS